MADTTKLASTFPAWRLTIGVKPENLMGAWCRCEDLGLLPKVCGFSGAAKDLILFQVFLPSDSKTVPVIFHDEITRFNGVIVNEVKTQLICPVSITRQEFATWKTITLGTGLKTADDFRKAIKDCGMKIGDWASDMLGKPEFVVATEKTEVDLVKVTVGELGFRKGARRDQIYERAKELGLELCPNEVGPQLRLQYKDQPLNEWLLIGMEPILASGGGLDVFNVGRAASGLWLGRYYGHPGDVWNAGFQWLFVRPRK